MDTPAQQNILGDPDALQQNVLSVLSTYLPPQSVQNLRVERGYSATISKVESDNLTWKRRVENLYNNGEKIGPDDLSLGGYKVNWKIVYEKLQAVDQSTLDPTTYAQIPKQKRGWRGLFYLRKEDLAALPESEQDLSEYLRLALDMGADPSVNDNYGTISVLASGNIPLIKRILADPRADPTARLGGAFGAAVRRKDSPVILALLLSDVRILAYTLRNAPEDLTTAMLQGSPAAAQIIIYYKLEVSPDTLAQLIVDKRTKIIKLLVESGRIDGNPYYTNAVDLLEETDDKQLELLNAVANNNVQETERLLKEYDVPAPRDEVSLRKMFDNKNQTVQKLLLQYKALPFTVHDNLILKLAGKRQNYQVMRMLLADPEVISAIKSDPWAYQSMAKDLDLVARAMGIHIM